MTFTNHANIQRLRRQNWAEYQLDAGLRRAMLEGCFIDSIDAYMNQHLGPNAWRELRSKMEWDERNNLLKSIITRTNILYSRPCRRAIVVKREPNEQVPATNGVQTPQNPAELHQEDQAFADLIATVDYDKQMAMVTNYTLATGMTMVRPYLNRGKLQFQVLTPDQIACIICDKDDPSRIVGLEYSIYYPQDYYADVCRTWIWDMTGLMIKRRYYSNSIGYNLSNEELAKVQAEYAGVIEVGEGGKILDAKFGPNYPYRDPTREKQPHLPFVKFAYQVPPGMAVNVDIGRDLFDATLRVAKLEADKAWVMHNQSFKQLFIAGPGASKHGNAMLDPTTPIVMDMAEKGEVEVKILDLTTDTKIVTEEIKNIFQTALIERGWSYEEFVMSASRQSAEAIEMQNEGKKVYLQQLETEFRPSEHELIHSIRVIYNQDKDSSAPAISMLGETSVNFGNPWRTNVILALDSIKELLNMNQLSAIDVQLMIDDDLVSREEAEQRIMQNIAENFKINQFMPETQVLSEGLPPPNQENPNR